MKVIVKHGDILDEVVDVMICSANPFLAMTGGVNGALLLRGAEDIQRELAVHIERSGKRYVPPGSVVRTSPGPVRAQHILHAVAVDAFYASSIELVQNVLRTALGQSADLSARTVAIPALATGYGPLSINQFALAVRGIKDESFGTVAELRVILRHNDDVTSVREVLEQGGV